MTVVDLTALINQLLPEPHAGLLSGILLGTKATLAPDLYAALITTGTIHIVALSGMNISILTKITHDSLLGLISRRIASLLTILLIIGFIWFVGPSSSVVRAGIMAVLTLCGAIFGRQVAVLYTWALAVSIMLLVNPAWLGDISFQLSALATLGIILFGQKPLSLPGIFRLIEDDLRTTLAAQVFTIPIILWHFGRISLVAPLTNVLVGWTMAPLTGIGIVAVAAAAVWVPLGRMVAWAAWVLLQYVIVAVTWTSKLPLASLGF